jgi:hypothetical protein
MDKVSLRYSERKHCLAANYSRSLRKWMQGIENSVFEAHSRMLRVSHLQRNGQHALFVDVYDHHQLNFRAGSLAH